LANDRQEKYKADKHLILGANGRPFRNWWGDSSIRDLAGQLGLADTYDQDYRFLSQMAHCTSQGVLMERVGNTLKIPHWIACSRDIGIRDALHD